jgi:hypothetical protein
MPPAPVFISHASADDAFVAELRNKLELCGVSVWVDSRKLRGGDKLLPEIEQAIRAAQHVLVVLSPQTINSAWVRKEIRLAETVAAEKPGYRLIPLLLPGIETTALSLWFDEEPLGVNIALEPGKLDSVLPHILAALGQRLPDDAVDDQQIAAQPLAELLLELSHPSLTRLDSGAEQLSAEARLVFIPADLAAQPEVTSKPLRLTAPIGRIEQDELRWYLEQYYRWPAGLFRERAERIEAQLPLWGQALYAATLKKDAARNAVDGWQAARGHSERRFSVRVDETLPEGASAEEQTQARIAASRWLGLPWELLHDGKAWLSDGAHPAQVRRRLPNYDNQLPATASLPIRLLLLSPRPEQEGVGYIDHRASAKPLVEAVAALGDLVRLTVLNPPTLEALGRELKRAMDTGQPYHVLHFDGHGVYDAEHGLGALCFEEPKDQHKLEQRGMDLVHADTLAALLRDHRIALVFLEACQTAQSEIQPEASVAAALLQAGVTSVIAMSHSVLVETARRFVTAFYQALAQGRRVGQAMLAGQNALRHNSHRDTIPGAGHLHLHDWFVPVLYQEQHDPQLFSRIPGALAQKMQAKQQQALLGALPDTPAHQFIGRSRELLTLERLLQQQPYAVILGMGGAGKTTLAVELCRWLVQTHRFDRCAFVSLEQYCDARGVLDALGRQLLPDYSVAMYGEDLDQALQPIARELENRRCLILLDNLESLVPTRGVDAIALSQRSGPLSHQGEGQGEGDLMAAAFYSPSPQPSPTGRGSRTANADLTASDTARGNEGLEVLELAQALLQSDAKTRLLFTSREALPAPFGQPPCVITLGALERDDAIALVTQVMGQNGLHLPADQAGNTPEAVTDLVDAVNCHARALLLLAQELARQGVSATSQQLQRIMRELDARHPGERENSLYASVELSLRRLSPAAREQVNGLAVLHEGGSIWPVTQVLAIEFEPAKALLAELAAVGLAEALDYSYHRFDPALTSYLALQLSAEAQRQYRQRWLAAMEQLLEFLYQQQFEDAQLAAQLTRLELANLLAFIQQQAEGMAAGAVSAAELADQAGSLEQLLANLHRPRALERVVALRHQAARNLGEWSRARFEHERLNIDRLLQQGALPQALEAAQRLLQQCQQAGEAAYAGADYDLAMAHKKLGQVLKTGGAAAPALPLLRTAQQSFERLGDDGASMVAVTLGEQGDCLRDLGQLDDAAAVYEEGIRRSKKLHNVRGVAVKKGQLATVRLYQKRYDAALQGYQAALALFRQLGEPATQATLWHQIGMVHRETGDYPQAEQAYRQSLAIESQQGNRAGEADTLGELGNLYTEWNRPEQAVDFFRQAADIHTQLGNLAGEGLQRSNLANSLIQLGRLDLARAELRRALDCKEPFGHAVTPWTTWSILHDLELADVHPAAASAARQQALQAFLAYRRDGGENHSGAGRLVEAAWQALRQGVAAEIEQAIAQLLQDSDWQAHQAFLHALQAILAGARDSALAEDETLHYQLAAELRYLLERLGQQRSSG